MLMCHVGISVVLVCLVYKGFDMHGIQDFSVPGIASVLVCLAYLMCWYAWKIVPLVLMLYHWRWHARHIFVGMPDLLLASMVRARCWYACIYYVGMHDT